MVSSVDAIPGSSLALYISLLSLPAHGGRAEEGAAGVSSKSLALSHSMTLVSLRVCDPSHPISSFRLFLNVVLSPSAAASPVSALCDQ